MFVPIVAAFFISLSIVSKITLAKNFAPYQSTLSFGLINMGILVVATFATIFAAGPGDAALLIFFVPVAGMATIIEMFIVFFIFRARNRLIANSALVDSHGSKIAKIVLLLIAAYTTYLIADILISEHLEKKQMRERIRINAMSAQLINIH